jgi:hypothetical protein
MRRFRPLLFALVCVLPVASVALAQKGNKPKDAHKIAIATFRCAGAVSAENPCPTPAETDDLPDLITSDGSPYIGSGDIVSGSGAFLRSDGEFTLQLRARQNRFVNLDFMGEMPAPSGNLGFTTVSTDVFQFNTRTINPETLQEVAGALLAVPIGDTWFARINASWTDASGVLYNIRFNPDNYPGSTYVSVTHEDRGVWSIEAEQGAVARIVSIPPSRGKPSPPVDEGLYKLPDRLTFTAPEP